MTRAPAEPIPAYLAELKGSLHGPRRRIDDMLREARHGLEDAAEAHLADGAEPDEAAHLAVEEFGPVAEVAPDYQVELAATATKRALLFLSLLAPAGNLMAWLSWKDAPPLPHDPAPGTWILSLAVDLIAWTVVAFAVFGTLALRFGSRWFRFRPVFARTAATAIFTVLVVTLVSGLALTFLFSAARGMQPATMVTELPAIGYLVAWIGLTWCGVRCLRTGRRAQRLRDELSAHAD